MTALSHASVPPPHSLDEDFRLLKAAVDEAGKLAHSYFRQEVAVRRKQDGSEVSDADIAVNEALKETLLGGRPDYGWLSEELEDDATRLERRLVWMIDPIDGTNAFLRHIPEWTISAALVQEGKPVLGAVFNPATANTSTPFAEAAPSSTTGRSRSPAGRRSKARSSSQAAVCSRSASGRSPGPGSKLRWVNSVAYRFALVAAGSADATVSLSAKSEWDLAAGVLIVEEAGGVVTDHHGHAFRFNLPVPRFPSLVAAPPGLHAKLIERTSRVDL